MFVHTIRALAAAVLLMTATAGTAQYYADTGRREAGPSLESAAAGEATLTTQTVTLHKGPNGPKAHDTLARKLAEARVDRTAVLSEGTVKSLRTFAEVHVHAITGRNRFERQQPAVTILSMLTEQSKWMEEAFLPVENPDLARLIGLEAAGKHRVSPAYLLRTAGVRDVIMAGMADEKADAAHSPEVRKALQRLRYRLATFLNLPTEFRLAPVANRKNAWVSPQQLRRPDLAEDPTARQRIAALDRTASPYKEVEEFEAALTALFENPESDPPLAGATAALQGAVLGAAGGPSPLRLTADYLQTRWHPFQVSAYIFLVAFLVYLYYLLVRSASLTRQEQDAILGEWAAGDRSAHSARTSAGSDTPAALMREADEESDGALPLPGPGGAAALPMTAPALPQLSLTMPQLQDKARPVWRAAFSLLVAGGLTLVFALVLRAIVGGRMPVSNLYESVTFALGAFAVVGIVFEAVYRNGVVGCATACFGWLLMTAVNFLPLNMRKVEPLVAVLDSIWLNYHVTTLLVSYSLFLLAFVLGFFYFLRGLAPAKSPLPSKEMLEYLCYRSVQVGWPLLTVGIFLGAVWANTAWGKYWSWDPKETWALITWLSYSVYLHLRMNVGWTGGRSVAAAMFGFAMVLVTYFGVSYLPMIGGGSMHSYAEPISR